MNGKPLSVDHGAPVRLMVPGWYGCVCVKWLDGIQFVGEDQPATSQMREFALRTHQKGMPRLARDYLPAVVDRTAAPVRAERWRPRRGGGGAGRRAHLGGERLTRKAGGVVRPGGAAAAGVRLPAADRDGLAFWSHRWKPRGEGIHRIRLGLLDSDAPARRLEMPVYGRKVEIPALA